MKSRWYLFFFLLLSSAFTGCGVVDKQETSDGNNTSIFLKKSDVSYSEIGITLTQEVPFSKESVKEIKAIEYSKAATSKPATFLEQSVIPFQDAPPPIELGQYC